MVRLRWPSTGEEGRLKCSDEEEMGEDKGEARRPGRMRVGPHSHIAMAMVMHFSGTHHCHHNWPPLSEA
jgi:hypothetical protein